MEAVQKAYPELLDQIRAAATAAAGKTTKRISSKTSRVLGQIMGGPARSYDRIAKFQAVHVAAAQQAQQPQGQGAGPSNQGPKSKRVQELASPTDRLESYPAVA
jgi:hypothetical protein